MSIPQRKKIGNSEWVLIRIAPETKFELMKLKGGLRLNTYDEVLRYLIADAINSPCN